MSSLRGTTDPGSRTDLLGWHIGLGRAAFNACALAAGLILGAMAWDGAPAHAEGEAPTVLALGTSLVAGYGLEEADTFPVLLERALAEAGTPARVVNAGVSGDTSAGGRARLDWLLADGAPDVLLVELGGNDGLRALDPDATRKNVAAIIEAGREAGATVLLTGMMAPPNLGREYAEAFNSVFPDLAREYDVLFYPFFLDGVAAEPDLNQPDGIHPNAQGVREIVRRITPAVQQALAMAGAS